MAKELSICDLLDIYSPLLSEKKRRFLELYYYDDLSLSEIVENEGGSRQGAQDMIKRAGKELTNMEEALHILENSKKRSALYKSLKQAVLEGNLKKTEEIITVLEEIN